MTELEGKEFRTNLYDPCVANMMINGWQINRRFHDFDLKILLNDKPVVDEVLAWFKSINSKNV